MTILWTVGVLIIVVWFLLHPAKPTDKMYEQMQGVNHAHRGLHSKDKAVAENSMEGFRLAVEKGYGIELDIQLSKDGEVVVFHDDDLKRVCGVDGLVCDYTAQQLTQMKLCETESTIPLFKDVLNLIDNKVHLIVELKTAKNRNLLCEKALVMLRDYEKSGKNFCIESFDPRIVAWFNKNANDICRGQLTDAPKNYTNQSLIEKIVLGNVLANCIARPHFIAHSLSKKTICVKLAQSMGALKVCWTVRDTDNFKLIEAKNHAVIFEFYAPETKYTLE